MGKRYLKLNAIAMVVLLSIGLGYSVVSGAETAAIVVNSLEDIQNPPAGTVTLRAALQMAEPAQPITFDPKLDGGTIFLSIVGEAHTILKGEVMGMRQEPSGPVSYLEGYYNRDYGPSALYAVKDVIIDAAALPNGITIAWAPGMAYPARVLAVYGDLTMTNVTITGGHSIAEKLNTQNEEDQPWTLARGAGVAVWGRARLIDCTLYNNHCVGDFDASRDRGAFGGGLYADLVALSDCIVAGNTVTGGGAAGGGVYSVGGAGFWRGTSYIQRSSVTGNTIQGLFVYGGGVYSDGGGIGNNKTLELTNTTVARNVAAPASDLPPFMLSMGYWRGGGVYVSNGQLIIRNCTIVENEVSGYARTDDLGKPNLAGGVAATIGNAHAVEYMIITQSIVSGNRVFMLGRDGSPETSYDQDIFSGSLLHFISRGYNRIGVIDFSQILVPVGEKDWESLCRKHFPKEGDMSGVDAADVLDLEQAVHLPVFSMPASLEAQPSILAYYEPAGSALDQVPESAYTVSESYFEYELRDGATNNFLEIMLARIERHYGLTGFAANFRADFETYLKNVDTDEETPGRQPYLDPAGNPILTLAQTQWFGPRVTWPKEVVNWAYIEFWHRLDIALSAAGVPDLGVELLGEAAWLSLFTNGPLAENQDIDIIVKTRSRMSRRFTVDQHGNDRPADRPYDIGAIEIP